MADLRREWTTFLRAAAATAAGTWLILALRRQSEEIWTPVLVETPPPAERIPQEPEPILALDPALALARVSAPQPSAPLSVLPVERASPQAPARSVAFHTVAVSRNELPSEPEPAPVQTEAAVSFTPEVPQKENQPRPQVAPKAPHFLPEQPHRPLVDKAMAQQNPSSRQALPSPRLIDYVRLYAGGFLTSLVAPFKKPRVRLSTAALLLAAVLWNSPVARVRLGSVLDLIGQPMHERAAFNWEERFDSDTPPWVQPPAASAEASGTIRVQGMAVHDRTRYLRTFAVDFTAKPERKSIGWVVGAADPENHAIFKLNERGRSAEGTRFELVRYLIAKGNPVGAPQSFPVLVTGDRQNFLEISVHVSEDQISTLVNGFGVDSWKRPAALQAGGLAFLAEHGDSFQIRSLTVSGNDDFLGLFLWGAEETMRSVHRNLGSLAASLHGAGMMVQNRT